jgi:hypothetical protein
MNRSIAFRRSGSRTVFCSLTAIPFRVRVKAIRLDLRIEHTGKNDPDGLIRQTNYLARSATSNRRA